MPHFRDPVHGYIEVSELEKKIIDSPPFQRLRNIHQLATTYLVYHGAEHTRFGHSLGVMHLVTRTFNHVVSQNPCLFRDDEKENEIVVMWYRQILRLIALLHDIGHAPFSHASEDLFPDGWTHESYTKEIIETTEIANYICEIGEDLRKEIITKMKLSSDENIYQKYKIQPITPQLLWKIYGEEANPIDGNYVWSEFLFLKSFMDGELDCDKMDYLLRDSMYCGVSYGKYDLERFIFSLKVYKDPKENMIQLAIDRGGIQAFEEFVLARYFMFIQVYFHKTRRYFDHVLIESLKEILPFKKYPKDIGEYLQWDDIRVMEEMRRSRGPFSKQYLERKTMSCIQESPAHAKTPDKELFIIKHNIVRKKYGDSRIWFDEIDKDAHKLLPDVYSGNDSGREVMIIDKKSETCKNIMDESLILQSIIDKIWICRIYADDSIKDEAINDINELSRKSEDPEKVKNIVNR